MSPKLLVDKYFAEKEKQIVRPTWFVTVVDHGDFETIHVTHGTKFHYPRPSHTLAVVADYRRAFALLRTYTATRFRASDYKNHPQHGWGFFGMCSLLMLGGIHETMHFKTAELAHAHSLKRKGILHG